MIIGDGIVLGQGGGATASIFVTGVQQSDTVTCTKGGRSYQGRWVTKQTVNPAYRNLPSGYTQVEYIQSSGSQWIDIGTTQDSSYTKIECKIARTNESGGPILGHYNGGTYNRGIILGVNSTGFGFGIGTSYENTYTISANDYKFHDLYAEASDGTYTYGLDGSYTSVSYSGMNVSMNDYLCTWNANGGAASTRQSIKIASLKLYKGNSNSIARDFVPCKDSNNIYGLYDMANNVFYDSDDAQQFTGGNIEPQYFTSQGWEFTNLNEYGTYTISATRGSKIATQNVLVDMATQFDITLSFVAHPEMAWSGTGTWATINGRDFGKINSGLAICGASYFGRNNSYFTGPLLVSQDADAVAYSSSVGASFSSYFTFQYNNETWYCCVTDYAWADQRYVTFTNVTSIRVDKGNYSGDEPGQIDCATSLLNYYFTGVQ